MTSEFLHADGTLSAGPALSDIAAKGRFFMIGINHDIFKSTLANHFYQREDVLTL